MGVQGFWTSLNGGAVEMPVSLQNIEFIKRLNKSNCDQRLMEYTVKNNKKVTRFNKKVQNKA